MEVVRTGRGRCTDDGQEVVSPVATKVNLKLKMIKWLMAH